MNAFVITISIIAIILSIFAIYACWKFVQGMKATDDDIVTLNKKCEENEQLIKKAIKVGAIDENGNLRKNYTIN